MQVFIFHGLAGRADEHWFPWLKKELESQGHTVTVPTFPHADDPKLDQWLSHMHQYHSMIDGGTIFVGHSLGVPFVLDFLETISSPIRASFFVAGFVGSIGPRFDSLVHTFAQKEFDWQKIRLNCREFHVFHSDTDSYVPLEKGKELVEKLDATLHFIPNAGHFNVASDFPELLPSIESLNPQL